VKLRQIATVSVLALATAGLGALTAPVTGDQIRTDTSLGGFSVTVNAAPFKVLIDDSSSPIPRPEGKAIIEADTSYTQAAVGTGPTSRGLAASFWPGALLGDGFPTLCTCPQQYPIKADARYPDRPYTADGGEGGSFMKASAMGLDATAQAKVVPGDIPGVVEHGTYTSSSTVTIKDKLAVGESTSRVTDLSLLAGIIQIGSVSTTLRVTSNGTSPVSTGSTLVTGLTVAGQGVIVDDTGAHPAGQSGTPPLLGGLDALGIKISGIAQHHDETENTANRTADGLRIEIDTTLLRSVLNKTPSPITDALYGVFSQAPPELQGFLFYSLAVTPKLTFIIGAGEGSAAATEPLSFELPPLPPITGGLTPVVPPAGGTALPPSTGGFSTPPVVGQPPQVVTPPLAPVAGSPFKNPYDGLPAALLLLAAVVAGFGGWGLTRLAGLAFAAGAVPRRRGPDGGPSSLPDLRGA
jgi:hypothetical protein